MYPIHQLEYKSLIIIDYSQIINSSINCVSLENPSRFNKKIDQNK